ncbi:hypothetical protein [Arcobacter caeni]|uniref:TnsE C-terminal domain-containing protein n=1 Tax=Arcobacter caeni TaxID=1912877 RepID=A0A363D2A3_9BACT|nr:hypothetical protein [Arcobacter caeni]PUE65480.1 hypothetical protein B0174_03935 [Arcobacter caeni]
MQEKNKIPYQKMPGNDCNYLVLNYGAAVKIINESSIPNIQVILRRIDINNQYFIKNYRDIIVYIPIPELDEVRIGSVWRKREKVLEKWKFFDDSEYMEDVDFNFDFNINPPQIVKFNEKIDSLNDSLSNIYKINFQNTDQYKIPYFNKTNYTKLISDDNITVLIPCIELFVSAYTPEQKQIKQRLLQFNIDDAINEFINLENSKIENQEYYIGLNKKMEDSNIKFLAYAKFNKTSRNRISKLSSSLELDEGYFIDKCQARYPMVLPYHPTHLFITSDGLWFNEKTFLVQRIYIISIPSDITVSGVIEKEIFKVEKKIYKPKEKEPKPKIVENEEENQNNENGQNSSDEINIIGINSNKQPKKRISLFRIKTQVNIIDENKPKIEILEKEEEKIEFIEDEKTENNKQIDIQNDEEISKKNIENIENVDGSDAKKLTSGDDSRQIKYLLSHCDVETNALFNQITEILNTFKIEKFIVDYKFLDKNFAEVTELKETTFYETLFINKFEKKELKDNWYLLRQRENGELKELGYRGYLLIEIKLADDKYCYLLEIGKKESESIYLGVIFKNINFNKLANKNLAQILRKIVINHGNYSKKDKKEKKFNAVDLGVRYKTYSHKFDEKLNKFINLDNTIKKKMKLLNILKI